MNEVTPAINNMAALAALLGINDVSFSIVIGKPPKDAKSVKKKAFAKRVQRAGR